MKKIDVWCEDPECREDFQCLMTPEARRIVNGTPWSKSRRLRFNTQEDLERWDGPISFQSTSRSVVFIVNMETGERKVVPSAEYTLQENEVRLSSGGGCPYFVCRVDDLNTAITWLGLDI